MPAIMAHHFFGQDAALLLPQGMLATEEELLAFLLGNQGSDPLCLRFSATPQRAQTCRRLARDIHRKKGIDALLALREAVGHLPTDDEGIGRAWVLGFLGHYALDSVAHPFIYAQQAALIHTGTGLANAAGEVHAIIESDIDVWMLHELRNLSVADVSTASFLTRTDRIDRVAGALVAQLGMQVFGRVIGVRDYGRAVNDYQRIYRAIDPQGRPRTAILSFIERCGRPHSYIRAFAHDVVVDENCPAANLARHPWTDPASGEPHTESFPDLYHLALERWERMAPLLSSGDRTGLEKESEGRNYQGMPEDG